ncbi:uncharacterized protein LOC107044885 isoform X2 [Diachasma alloeum]|uniref:uncharacterized protein LOC107044885 isoform X2 n=1 Tax=Diachasma alloeum TaxID=454923 RepID=UPI00073840E9|nr:uncharacterized protein LOC107044885 isoform X2 [Diachasma alloeum]
MMKTASMEPTTRTLFTKACEFPSSDANICKCEITTSVSGQGFVDPTIDTAMEHESRKINFARRRQYVDSPCSVPALSIQAVGQVQTDCRITSPGEAQTMKAQMKETIIQTTSTDTRQESNLTPQQYLATGPCLPSTILCPQYQMPCSGVCPASVVIVRGALSGSCCGSCNCSDHPEKPPLLHHINGMQDNIYERPQDSALQRTTTSIIVDSDIDRTSGDQVPEEKGSSAQRRIYKNTRRI